MNSYFAEHPEMVLGNLSVEITQYGREECTVDPIPGADLAEQLHQAVSRIHGQYQAAETVLAEGEDTPQVIPADPRVKNFSYTVVDDAVYFRENSVMRPVELNEPSKGRVRGLVELRQTVNELIDYGVDLQGYGTQQFCGARFNLIAGWSDRVLSFINLAEAGMGSMVKEVENYNQSEKMA